MKITSNLTHVATEIEFEAPLNEEELLAVFEKSGVQGFPAELDIAERTEDHVQMMSLDGLLGFAKASGLSAVTYDVTYFPHADDAEVAYQLRQLARDLEISAEVIRDVCAAEIQEYLALDAKRDAGLPVHSIVEAYTGGTAFAWYGMSDYPRLKRFILRKLAQGGQKAKHSFIMPARPRWICSTSTDRLLRLNLRVALRPVSENAARPKLCVSRGILGGARLLQNGLHAFSGQGSRRFKRI